MSKEIELLKRCLEKTDVDFDEELANEIEALLAEPEPEPVAWMYDWEDFDGDEVNISYGHVTTDKNVFDTTCALNITPLIKLGADDE